MLIAPLNYLMNLSSRRSYFLLAPLNYLRNLEVPGSIPGSRRSLLGNFLVMLGSLFRIFWEVLGSVWEYCGGGLRWVWEGLEKKFRGGRKINIFKSVREYFSCVGRFKTITVSLFPDRKPKKNTLFNLYMIFY